MKYWDKGIQLIDGCTPVSEGCLNCWSARMTHQYRGYLGVTEKINGRVRFNGKIILNLDKFQEKIPNKGNKVIQVWNDLYYMLIKNEDIYKAYKIMSQYQNHIFLVLTKRHQRMTTVLPQIRSLLPDRLNHIWHGITAENQKRLEQRLPYLLQIPGKRFISIEPILEEIEIIPYVIDPNDFENDPMAMGFFSAALQKGHGKYFSDKIHQVICGAETGHHARPCNPDWLRSLRDQCEQAGIPFFLKQVNSKRERILDGREYNDLVWRKK